MSMVQKLELNWIGKHDPKNKISPEPRILVENPEYSYSNSKAIINEQLSFGEETKNKTYFDNMLIHGDNLLALKSLELEYAGKIKCIYIDPPYNTGSAFEHYDDNLEHSTWLSLMKPRLELLKTLLSNDGSIFIQIDDDEQAYLKVICDEVFGRSNFVTTIAVKMSTPSGVKLSHRDKKILKIKEFILVYAKNKNKLKLNPQYKPKSKWDNYYEWYVDRKGKNPINWRVFPLKGILEQNGLSTSDINNPQFKKFYLENSDKIWQRGRNTNIPEKVLEKSKKNWDTVFEYKNNEDSHYQYCYKGRRMAFLSNVVKNCIDSTGKKVKDIGTLICDFWDDISTAALFSEGKISFPNGKKPETLIQRILEISTNPGDLVLDSFLGSGTTAAVAHKMGRRWIGIELGNHAYTHCYKRLKAVVDGEQGGISKGVNWQGGGGFKFYELAPSLIEKDKFGNPVVSDKYTGEMLAKAIAKHKGYYYQPNAEFFWKQSKNGDKNFLYVTENHITPQDLNYIHTLMKQDEHLLVCAPSYESECSNQFPNITIQQIPKVLFGKCDFMKEGYSLNVNQNENSEEDNCNE